MINPLVEKIAGGVAPGPVAEGGAAG